MFTRSSTFVRVFLVILPATCMGFIAAGVFFITNSGWFCENVRKLNNAQNVIVYFLEQIQPKGLCMHK